MIDKYIKEILSEHGKVYIPKLGLIYKELETKGNPFDPSILKKPVYIYKVDSEYYNDEDTWLVYAIARGEHTTIDQAETLVRQRVDEMKMLLEEGEEVRIDRVGAISVREGKMAISTFNSEESDDSFGIPKEIRLEFEESGNTIVQEESEPIEEKEFSSPEPVSFVYTEPEKVEEPPVYLEKQEVPVEENNDFYTDPALAYDDTPRKSKTGLIAAIIIFLLIGAGLVYFFILQPRSSEPEIAVVPPVEESEEYDSAQFATTTEEVESYSDNKPLSVKEEGKRYYIIAGSFTINENAQKFKRRLDAKGLKPKVIEAKENQSTYRVSLADFEEFQDAFAQTESLKKKYGNSIWILKY